MNKLLVLPLFFAAASAGLIGTPLTTSYALGHAAYASPYAVGVAHAPLISAPIVRSYGPSVYSTPLVKHVAPVAYSAPIVKTVIPAATSYANTYRVSHSVAPVISHAVAAPIVSHAVAAPVLSHGIASPVYGHAVSPYALASPLAYSHGLGLLH